MLLFPFYKIINSQLSGSTRVDIPTTSRLPSRRSTMLYVLVANSGITFEGTMTGANACSGSVTGGLFVEMVLTFIFVLVVLGTTDDKKKCWKFCRISNWFMLNINSFCWNEIYWTSVNQARSIGPHCFKVEKPLINFGYLSLVHLLAQCVLHLYGVCFLAVQNVVINKLISVIIELYTKKKIPKWDFLFCWHM